MNLDRPLCFLDIESTGTDPVLDRIIELGVSIIKPGADERVRWESRFNPGIPIPPAATAVHCITDIDVADCQPFSERAAHIHKALQGKDLAGYNLWRFDLPILDEELRRCGYKLDLRGVRVVDCFGIFSKKEPRKLEDAVRRYCGRDPLAAHSASADAEDTAEVLLGQLATYPDLDAMNMDDLAAFSWMSDQKPADLAGKLYRDAEGHLRYAFGKWKDQRVLDQQSYACWMLSKDFPGSTKEVLTAELDLA